MLKMKNLRFDYGVCGKKAPFQDSNGDNLYTGDVVTLIHKKTNISHGQKCIVEQEGKIFVMGIESDCPNYEQNWEIYKEKSYKSVKDKDEIDGIKYYKEDEEIDIQKIEEYKTVYTERCIDMEVRDKINEIIRTVNEMYKEIHKEYCENCGVELTKKNKYMKGMCMECKCGIDWEEK